MQLEFINKTYGEERALYGVCGALVKDCRFEGEEDGESCLKESADILCENCDFKLRYPLWHVNGGKVISSRMSESCRAALWYDRDIILENCDMNGIKALRECEDSEMINCRIVSAEFGWNCRGVKIKDCILTSEYPFFGSRDLYAENFSMTGKYSFQYLDGGEIHDSVLNTKDAFWHSKNVTVYDSEINGEYLGWYSENLRLVRCRIRGTQPLCYAKGLVLEDCVMEDADLCFERSTVNAKVKGHIISVKNILSGKVEAESIGEIINDDEGKYLGNIVIC